MGVYQKRGEWYIDYYVNGKRVRELVGPNKYTAINAYSKRKSQLAEGRYFEIVKNENILLSEFFKIYLENHSKVNKKSWISDEFRSKTLNKYFGNLLLTQITKLGVEKYKSDRAKVVSPATVNRELALLKNVFSKAIEWEKYHRHNPVSKVKQFREDNARLRFLSDDEIARLYEHCDGELAALIKFAVNTGMRRGEIMGLEWNDVDIQKGLIYIKESKAGKGRIVPMNETVKNLLLCLPRKMGSNRIFQSNHNEQFKNRLKTANIQDVTFHTLRHTTASHLVMQGVDILTVSRILGHSDIKMTMRYAHLSQDFLSGAVRTLDTKWTPKHVLEPFEDESHLTQMIDI